MNGWEPLGRNFMYTALIAFLMLEQSTSRSVNSQVSHKRRVPPTVDKKDADFLLGAVISIADLTMHFELERFVLGLNFQKLLS